MPRKKVTNESVNGQESLFAENTKAPNTTSEKKDVPVEKKQNKLRFDPVRYGFDPELVAISTGEEKFVPVNGQIQWFNAVYPNGRIDSKIVGADKDFAIVQVSVYKDAADTVPAATTLASRFCLSVDVYKCNHIDEAFRGALGQALKCLGFSLNTTTPEDAYDALKKRQEKLKAALPEIDKILNPVPEKKMEAEVKEATKAPNTAVQAVPPHVQNAEAPPVCPPAEWEEPVFNVIPADFVADMETQFEEVPNEVTASASVAVSEDASANTNSNASFGFSEEELESAMNFAWPFNYMKGTPIRELLANNQANAIKSLKWARDEYAARGVGHNIEVKKASTIVLAFLESKGVIV